MSVPPAVRASLPLAGRAAPAWFPRAAPVPARRPAPVGALRDLTGRVSATVRLAHVEKMARVHGEGLLDAIVEGLAGAVGACYALVGECVPPAHDRLRLLSVWAGDGHTAAGEVAMVGAPWAELLRHGFWGQERDLPPLVPPGAFPEGRPAASFAGVVLRDNAGAAIGVLAVAHDRPLRLDDDVAAMLAIFGARAAAEIERRRLEAAREHARRDFERRTADRLAALQAANQELEAFSFSVAHDLRAPLRQIAGFAALLEHEAEHALSPVANQHLTDIVESARGMARLIDRMLQFSRAGAVRPRDAEVDLRALARAVVADLSCEAEGRAIDWHVGELPRVRGDAVLLRQVLYNLVSNAVKYSRPCNLACIEIGALTTDGDKDVVCFVRDNGVGFDMRHVQKLFGVFRRLHADSAFEGTGVGLATVRRIVHRHGGRVWATGEVGGGATFYFSLPASAPADGEAAWPTPAMGRAS